MSGTIDCNTSCYLVSSQINNGNVQISQLTRTVEVVSDGSSQLGFIGNVVSSNIGIASWQISGKLNGSTGNSSIFRTIRNSSVTID